MDGPNTFNLINPDSEETTGGNNTLERKKEYWGKELKIKNQSDQLDHSRNHSSWHPG
jgi:hypothetical protein